jgi:hypothetical protein
LHCYLLPGFANTSIEKTSVKTAAKSLAVKQNKISGASVSFLELGSFEHHVQNLLPHVESASVNFFPVIQDHSL